MKPSRAHRDLKPANVPGEMRVNFAAEDNPAAVAKLEAILMKLLARRMHSGGG